MAKWLITGEKNGMDLESISIPRIIFNDLSAAVNRRYRFPLKCFQPSGGVMVALIDNDR